MNASYLVSFIQTEFPDFTLTYASVFKYKKFRLRMTGVAGGEKLKIFSHYSPTQLKKELDLGYKLILKHEGEMILIDLKKVLTVE